MRRLRDGPSTGIAGIGARYIRVPEGCRSPRRACEQGNAASSTRSAGEPLALVFHGKHSISHTHDWRPMKKARKKLTFANKAVEFYRTLTPPRIPSARIQVINPHGNPNILRYAETFFNKFFDDTNDRIFVFGINPGRFGSGATGIPFTDSTALENSCGIPNSLEKRRELSSQFIYRFIDSWGGTSPFYKHFFLTAVSPIGFLCDGTNYNYYDDPVLLAAVRPFLIATIETQLAFGARRRAAIVLGTGKNQRRFNALNQERRFFQKVYALEHPRFIMQYRGKHVSKYQEQYQRVFAEALSHER